MSGVKITALFERLMDMIQILFHQNYTMALKFNYYVSVQSKALIGALTCWLCCQVHVYQAGVYGICMLYQNQATIIGLKIIWSTMQHDYILTWTAYEPFILCLSCNKWSCGTYQHCWKEWNALIRQRCYRESTYCQSTDTERHNYVGQY